MKIINYSIPLYSIPLILTLLFAVGCGGPTVTGTVKLTDGTAVTTGDIVFQTPAREFRSYIRPDGSYTITGEEKKGVTAGTYTVYFSGYGEILGPPPMDDQGNSTGPPVVLETIEAIMAEKYLNPRTSELTLEVKGSMKHDFVLEPK